MIKPVRKLSNSFRKRFWYFSHLLSWKEYWINSFDGLKFAVRRYSQIQRREISVHYPVRCDYERGLVTIAILSKDGYDRIRPCIESLEKYCGKHKIEIIIGDIGTKDKQVPAFYRKAVREFRNIRVVRFKTHVLSRNYNELIRKHAGGEYLVFLSRDTIVTPGWLDALVAPLEDRRIGIVGAKLLNRDGTIQHAGIEYNGQGEGLHIFHNEPSDVPVANVSSIIPGVTFTCAAMRHDVYDRFRLSEDFIEEAQDNDLCLRLRSAGFIVLYEPRAELFHFGGSANDRRKDDADRLLFMQRWKDQIHELSKSGIQRIPFNPEYYHDAIVVIRDDGIGDLLMGIAAFRKLRDTYPHRKLVLFTYERNAAMMDGFGIFDEIFPIENGKKYLPLPIPSKKTTVYNLIDLEMNFGGAYGKSKEENKVHRHVAFARTFGLDDCYEEVPMPEYPEAKARVEEILLASGARMDDPFVVFNLMASNPARSWWEPYYPVLIEAVEKMGFVPVFIGTKECPFLKGERAINLVGKTATIPEYIEALKFGKYVISTDTSACHIAGLSSIPFLAIFTGGVLAEARLNYYRQYEVIEPEGITCYPCWDEGCKKRSTRWKKDPCRIMVTPDKVIAQFKKLVLQYPIDQ